ncbi:MAG TPA: peptidylprolyl isomerase [Lachnospiraceae bacterium]|nr:peptidylprolyl isomerase [Lachnospiraceae bacterium]
MRIRNRKNADGLRLCVLCLVLILLFVATGCGVKKDTEIILTTDFEENEVFRIEHISCMLPEVMVYLTTARNQYEGVFGEEIWHVQVDESTLDERFKDIVMARIARIKAMNLLAEEHEVKLDATEEAIARRAAQEYMTSLGTEQAETLHVNEDLIYTMYAEYALANKVYEVLTSDVNPEISDDEARTITVKQILIKTYTLDDAGNRIDYLSAQKADAYERCVDILNRARTGEDFDALALAYNEDVQTEYSFGKGVMPQNYETAAFNLAQDEISDVIETEYGYHIIKCINTFDKEETDANKLVIVNQRKEEAFSAIYDAFLPTLTSHLNDDLWQSVNVDAQDGVTSTDFFDIYNALVENY